MSLAGELDLAGVPRVEAALRLEVAPGATVVVDLRRLEFIDGSGAHLLIHADRRLREAGGRLVVVRGGEVVSRFFALIGLEETLEVVDRPPRRRLPAVGADRGRETIRGGDGRNATSHFSFEGDADSRDVVSLQRALVRALENGHRRLTLDLGGLTALDAPSVSELCVALHALRLSERHARVQVLGAPPLVARILGCCEIDGVSIERPATDVAAAAPAALAAPQTAVRGLPSGAASNG